MDLPVVKFPSIKEKQFRNFKHMRLFSEVAYKNLSLQIFRVYFFENVC